MKKHLFKGSHILAEFYGVSNTSYFDDSALCTCLEYGCQKANVTLLKYDYSMFDNGGYTAFALLEESHISIHTYPEYQAIFLDVFTCGNTNTRMIVDILEEYYQPTDKKVQIIERGKEDFNL
ncbi:MAG: adenosylmethionine decarboxylase [Bacteroides sp.]|nr:adenosylmethionine decarboxylase [Bacteroides sp.]